jgi:hypothetical protein
MNLASGGIPDRAEVEDEAFDGPLAHHRVGIEKYLWARGRRTGGRNDNICVGEVKRLGFESVSTGQNGQERNADTKFTGWFAVFWLVRNLRPNRRKACLRCRFG